MLYTQCPDCGTIFRITADQLRTAVGQVRCGRCGSLFNAINSLSEDPVIPAADFTLSQVDQTARLIHSSAEEPFGSNPPMTAPLGHADEPPAAPDLRPAENQVPANLVRAATAEVKSEWLSDAADRPAEGIQPLPRAKDPLPPPPMRSRFQSHNGHDILAKEYGLEEPRRSRARGLWGFAGLLLVGLLVGQILWREPQLFTRAPWLHVGLSSLCRVVGCTPPQLRDPGRFEPIGRDFTQDPRHPGALLVSLTLRNNADFAQPPPRLDIRLYSQQGSLAGRRIFNPGDYEAGGELRLIPAGGEHLINLSLVDPGREISGFRFELL